MTVVTGTSPPRARAHAFALANALWESETPERVWEAVAVGMALMEGDGCNPTSDWGLRIFLLDVMMECGAWDKAAVMLAQHNETANEEWLWGKALVYFKARGGGRTATRALEQAIAHNPRVLHLLTQRAEMSLAPSDRAKMPFLVFKQGRFSSGGVQGDQRGAEHFMSNFGKHWLKNDPDGANRALKWLAEVGEKPRGRAAQAGEGVDPRSITPLDTSKVVCSNPGCGILPDAASGLSLFKCSACGMTQYCGRECQLEHWKKGHKKVCTKERKKGKKKKKQQQQATEDGSDGEGDGGGGDGGSKR